MAFGRTSHLLKRLSPPPARAQAEIPNFSYATPEHTLPKRMVIRLVDRLTGQPRMTRLYLYTRSAPVPAEALWSAAVHQLLLERVYARYRCDPLPHEGPPMT